MEKTEKLYLAIIFIPQGYLMKVMHLSKKKKKKVMAGKLKHEIHFIEFYMKKYLEQSNFNL